MADAGEFIDDAQILEMCGTGASATVKVAGWFDKIIVRAESDVSCATRFDWVTYTSAALTATMRGILGEATGCLAAIIGISFDMSGYTSRLEAEDLINILRDRYLFLISILRDKKTQKFIKEA